jgi:hypothetical protein
MSGDPRHTQPVGHDGSQHPSAEPGYETSDARAGATIRAGLYMAAAVVAVVVAVVPLYRLLARSETAEQPRPATVLRETPAEGSFPKLVASEPLALASFRAQEDALLDGYAWVEKDRGIVRIPIAEAVKIIGERGRLPVFPPPLPVPGAHPTAPPAAGGGR